MKINTKPANKPVEQNNLWQSRQRTGLERKQVAALADKTADEISRYERGAYQPNLKTALKLEIIYRMPVRLLFQELFRQLEREIGSRRKRHPFPDNNWFPPHIEQLNDEQFCFYAELLKNRIPNELELSMLKKHVVNLMNVASGYPVRQ